MSNNVYMLSSKDFPKNQQLCAGRIIINKNYHLHFHDFFEIELITNGEGRQILNGKTYPLKRGAAYLIRPTDFHSIETTSELSIQKIMFNEAMLSNTLAIDIIGSTTDYFALFEEEEFSRLSELIQCLQYESDNDFEMRNAVEKNLLECIIICIMRKTRKSDIDTKDNQLRQALSYIHLNYRNAVTLKQSAKSINMTPAYFSSWFHKNTGKTYTEYLTSLRLSYAEKRLITSSDTITEICFDSGFYSVSNFLKEFKKKNNTTPKNYRKALK
ncbi:MAG: helix-turn-helix domain-containing protein [Ruminococcaceae bacterium]|nr:helix-turn-helix domain-containing protein [Oscillospiraceae bacterium]